jgi:hypothetical protein
MTDHLQQGAADVSILQNLGTLFIPNVMFKRFAFGFALIFHSC